MISAQATRPLTEALLNLTRKPGSVAACVARTYAADAALRAGAPAADDPFAAVDADCFSDAPGHAQTGNALADVLVALAAVRDLGTRTGWARAFAQVVADPGSHAPRKSTLQCGLNVRSYDPFRP